MKPTTAERAFADPPGCCDASPSVPEGKLNAIFEPFFRGRTTKGTDGHDLGLAIARRTVEAHGGMIYAANRPYKGLHIKIMLPVRGTISPQ